MAGRRWQCGVGMEERTGWMNGQDGRTDSREEQTGGNVGQWIEAGKRKQSVREGGEEAEK